jgi:phage portal protein BeeE
MQVRANYSVGVYQLGRPVWAKANLTSYLAAYEQVVVVYSAINLIADAAASAKVRVYDESKDDAEAAQSPTAGTAPHPEHLHERVRVL